MKLDYSLFAGFCGINASHVAHFVSLPITVSDVIFVSFKLAWIIDIIPKTYPLQE